MSKESYILISNASVSGTGEKCKGAGYNRQSAGLHTVVYAVDAFRGAITIQGTLELYPAESDWVDVTSYDFGGDSTISAITTTHSENFTGNFVWIRADYSITSGTIVSVRYNY